MIICLVLLHVHVHVFSDYCHVLHVMCMYHDFTVQMSFHNVAIVFGPTLMRGTAQDMLTTINESYTIVETLCTHVRIMWICDCVCV